MSAAPSAAPVTSGDPIADRRFAHARDYAAAGEPAAAAELAEQALELVPQWAAGWFLLGEFAEAAGLRETAITAFERALALDPSDRCGAVLRLARCGARPAPDAPPPAHVRDLFDGYADRFEAALVDRLGYRAPDLLAAAIEAAAPGRRFALGLDLGCGTGLMGERLRGRVDRLEGQDLAPAMLARAAAKGIYDALVESEVVADLGGRAAGGVDLVTAADVFCYLGDLRPVIGAAARVLGPGGLFAFTVESAGDGDTVTMGEALRFAHGRAHLARAAAAAGLTVARFDEVVLRRDRGVDVGGFLILLTKS